MPALADVVLSTNTRRSTHNGGALPFRRQTPHRVFVPDPNSLGTTRRATDAFSHALALSPTAGDRLFHRLRFPVGSNRRTCRQSRHRAGDAVHGKRSHL